MANKGKFVGVRLTEYEKLLLDKLSSAWGTSPSDVIRGMIVNYGNRLLAQERALEAVGRDTQQPAPEANNER